ncbi:agamous-like MADS-box protein AGL62 [Cicer arietinum]|uniref:Agamous-like MADS-box protein AGL62 n=1 Tax=Cicer arietinum TaxID=3827 RepID=A0A1S2YVH2_CICAR|nr:agamous-like MADS-box protein AGL62 [Cicer arietinum]
MVSSNGNNTSTKSSKRKIDIKKIEQSNKLQVSFSKRKLGLFNKVTELSILCQAKTAMIITSPNEKLYACGYPNPDSVINQFITQENNVVIDNEKKKQDEEIFETLRFQYEELQEKLKEETNNLLKERNKGDACSTSWWDRSIDDMSVESLEQFKNSLENLKLNIVTALEEKRVNSIYSTQPHQERIKLLKS